MIFKNSSLGFCFFLVIITTAHLNGGSVIFDLGGVLIETNMRATLWQLGPKDIMLYLITNRKGPHAIKAKLYEVLHAIEPAPSQLADCTRDDEGKIMPTLMLAWLVGREEPSAVLTKVTNSIDNHPEWFSGYIEQKLVRRVAHIIFDPLIFATTRSLIQDGVDFVHYCKSKGHKIYILSNWPEHSLDIFKAQHPDFFKLFDGIILSSRYQCAKPDSAIFRHLREQHNLDPESSFFIDDQAENIHAARMLGFETALCCNTGRWPFESPDFMSIKNRLAIWELTLNESSNSAML